MSNLKYVDLFAGIGGFRQALKNVNIKGLSFTAVAACEIDTSCRQLYEDIFQINKNDEVFIADVKEIKVKNNEGHIMPKHDMLFAGFPCQPFSNVGKRGSFDDPRGALFFDILAILNHYKPKFFILENVSKIVTIDKGNLLKKMVLWLEEEGYHVHYWDLFADDYGLPQKRHRLFFCGVRKDFSQYKKDIEKPPYIPRDTWKYPTAWHLLERSMNPRHIIPKKTRETVLKRNPKWMGGLEINLPIARPITASMAKWHRANQDNYYSESYISSSNPNPYKIMEVDIDSETIRRITPLEGFRLQGFPDKYSEVLEYKEFPLTTVYRMIGNAVPVNLTSSVIEHFLNEYL